MPGYVYIMTNRKNGTLYTGVCADIAQRATQHREGKGGTFTTDHDLTRLVHIEHFEDITDAIRREKAIKKWRRAWKVELIEAANPDWRDLYFDLNC